jgi:excisionase family DNA binding protein
MNTTHELSVLIKLQGTRDVMERLTYVLGQGIGSVVQSVSVQPQMPIIDRVTAEEYAKQSGLSARKVRKMCNDGKLKHTKSGRKYLIHTNQIK